MYTRVWSAVKSALEDLPGEEANWRPLPEANSIAVIVRHLRIESEWHLDSLKTGAPMPTIAVTASQEGIDAISDDFDENWKAFQKSCSEFLEVLRTLPLLTLVERNKTAYGQFSESGGRMHLLSYHQAIHLAMHCGQIRTIRNLYRKTRGEPARFFPENPSYRGH